MIDMNIISLSKDSIGQDLVIFRVPTKKAGTAYMCVRKVQEQNDNRFVVLVNSNRFIALWRNEPYSVLNTLAFGGEEVWRSDRKYGRAVDGFSNGYSNPVPLPDVVCYEYQDEEIIWNRKWIVFKTPVGIKKTSIVYAAFINGVTRTLWLLANGAEYFPVICRGHDEAKRLHSNAGVNEFAFINVPELYKSQFE